MIAKLHLVSFDEGVAHLSEGRKIVPTPTGCIDYKYLPGEYPNDYCPKLTCFDDGSVMTLVSDWESGYYGEVDPKEPLFYLGTLTEDK